MADVLKNSQASDWRPLDINNTLYLELEKGRVVIELAPGLAPLNVENIKALVKENYFDGLAVIRSQENYVVQWGDPTEKREWKIAKSNVEAELGVKLPSQFNFTRLPDADGYARQVGHVNSLPVGRDPQTGKTWLAHCYASVGVARGNESNSGNGSSLYVVSGHAPRQLDRNVTVVGRVMLGMELLTSLPHGTEALGFYSKPEEMAAIKSIRLASDVAESERSQLEILRSDTKTFSAVVDAQRHRGGEWYKFSPDYIELCNVPVVVRPIKSSK